MTLMDGRDRPDEPKLDKNPTEKTTWEIRQGYTNRGNPSRDVNYNNFTNMYYGIMWLLRDIS